MKVGTHLDVELDVEVALVSLEPEDADPDEALPRLLLLLLLLPLLRGPARRAVVRPALPWTLDRARIPRDHAAALPLPLRPL